MKPRVSILNKQFKWVPSAKTNLKKTFARIRKEQAAEKQARDAVVTPILRKGGRP